MFQTSAHTEPLTEMLMSLPAVVEVIVETDEQHPVKKEILVALMQKFQTMMLKGTRLYRMMFADDEEVGQMFEPPRNSIANNLLDRDDFQTWGYTMFPPAATSSIAQKPNTCPLFRGEKVDYKVIEHCHQRGVVLDDSYYGPTNAQISQVVSPS